MDECKSSQLLKQPIICNLPWHQGGTFQKPPVKDSPLSRPFQSQQKTVYHRGHGPAKQAISFVLFCLFERVQGAVNQGLNHV